MICSTILACGGSVDKLKGNPFQVIIKNPVKVRKSLVHSPLKALSIHPAYGLNALFGLGIDVLGIGAAHVVPVRDLEHTLVELPISMV